jgi:hypothetical protein
MKVYIGPYKSWIGPYQIADAIFFWHKKYSDSSRWDYRLHYWLSDWLSDTWVDGFCRWIHSKQKRKINVHIDNYDTWSMDHTLSLIILPMLKQLKATSHGHPISDPEDAPHIGKGDETEYGSSDTNVEARWNWILDEMIYTFECEIDLDWEDQFISGVRDISWEENEKGLTEMKIGPNDTYKLDEENRNKAWDRRKNGLRLFGKYYNALWD